MALINLCRIKKQIPKLYDTFTKCCYAKFVSDRDMKKCYAILGIPEDSDQEKIRSAYLELVKKYHPDSSTSDSNAEEFQKIDKAFKVLLVKKNKERWCTESVNFEIHPEEFDIKHTAPQHRQYLNYDGCGVGTPSQREKQYGKKRAMQAAENLMNHRVNKAQADEKTLMEKKSQTHKIKTKYGLERLVEDLIVESMSKGDFDNLSGKGKPLKTHENTNPYVDFVTHKLNQVLIDNGFTPEWIMLQKEIREDKTNLLKFLHNERKRLSSYPFESSIDAYLWDKTMETCHQKTQEINKKIEKYNLVVPILQKQMVLVNYEKEAEHIVQFGKTLEQVIETELTPSERARFKSKNLFSFIESFFVK